MRRLLTPRVRKWLVYLSLFYVAIIAVDVVLIATVFPHFKEIRPIQPDFQGCFLTSALVGYVECQGFFASELVQWIVNLPLSLLYYPLFGVMALARGIVWLLFLAVLVWLPILFLIWQGFRKLQRPESLARSALGPAAWAAAAQFAVLCEPPLRHGHRSGHGPDRRLPSPLPGPRRGARAISGLLSRRWRFSPSHVPKFCGQHPCDQRFKSAVRRVFDAVHRNQILGSAFISLDLTVRPCVLAPHPVRDPGGDFEAEKIGARRRRWGLERPRPLSRA